MYKHILIEVKDNVLDFFNVKEFEYDQNLNVYRLLSQNDEWHFFEKGPSTRVII